MKRKLFLLLLCLTIIMVYKTNNEEISIPNESIRLRVIPNSNEPKDINVKKQVKTYLEKDIYNLVKNIDDIDSARSIIKANLTSIESNIDIIFKNNNYTQNYKVNYGNNYFPEKTYAGKTYDEGYYESLVIYIGEAKGDNWWCVLFPNFCLVDQKEDITYKSFIKDLINKIF